MNKETVGDIYLVLGYPQITMQMFKEHSSVKRYEQ